MERRLSQTPTAVIASAALLSECQFMSSAGTMYVHCVCVCVPTCVCVMACDLAAPHETQ